MSETPYTLEVVTDEEMTGFPVVIKLKGETEKQSMHLTVEQGITLRSLLYGIEPVDPQPNQEKESA